MKAYHTNTPRALLGFAALAMAATTIAALVIVPAKLDAATAAGSSVPGAITCVIAKEKQS